jgi:4-amino-4-deoxy-L-arabinose transferase-like glycosyltransferase
VIRVSPKHNHENNRATQLLGFYNLPGGQTKIEVSFIYYNLHLTNQKVKVAIIVSSLKMEFKTVSNLQRAQRSVFRSPHLGFSIMLGLCAFYILYFFRMGSYPLFDPDEPVYGQVAREMVASTDWLTPHLNGGLWFDKPPLFYWLSAASVWMFGPTEFACRLPSALGAVALVLLVYALARYDFGPRAAWLCALIMATCLQQIVLARAAVTDMTFVLCLTAALYGYRRWLDESPTDRRSQMLWALFCGAATGLAMLTKGPVAPLLLSTAFLRQLRSASTILAVAMALLIGLPWYATMYFLHGQEFVQGFLVANNITRFLKAEHADQTGHWYSIFLNVPVLLIFFFPWSAFLPQALLRAWRQGRNRATTQRSMAGMRLALVWFGVVFVFFSLSKTQLVTYIFPLYPAAALLVGALWSEVESDAAAWRSVYRGLAAALLLSALLAVVLVLAARKQYVEAQVPALVAGAVLLVAGGVAMWLSRRQTVVPTRASWVLGAGMVILTLWLMTGVMPYVTAGESTRDLVEQLPPQAAALAEHKVHAPSLLFYMQLRPQIRYLGALDLAGARRALLEDTPLFIVCRARDEDEVMVAGAREWARSGELVALGNAAAMVLPRGDSHAS